MKVAVRHDAGKLSAKMVIDLSAYMGEPVSVRLDDQDSPSPIARRVVGPLPPQGTTGKRWQFKSQSGLQKVKLRDLAPTLPVHTPYCYHAANEPGTAPYVVLLEDAAPAVQGDQMAGCSIDEAATALDEAALLHGSRWGDPSLAELAWLNRRADSHPADMAAFVRMMLPQFFDR